MEKELAAVSEKPLLLAGNITAALDRYAQDVSEAFDYLIHIAGDQALSPSVVDLVRHICRAALWPRLSTSDAANSRWWDWVTYSGLSCSYNMAISNAVLHSKPIVWAH